jgi:hypothetical protein
MASDEFRYQPPSARAALLLAPCVVVADLVLVVLFPQQRDIPLFLPLLASLGWLAWIVWGYPMITISDAAVTARNTWFTQVIPLGAIDEVSGGKRLTIRTRDRRKHIPAAVPSAGSFLAMAARRTDAYGSFLTPVAGVDRLRIDADRERTPATVVAQVIRRRIDHLPAGSGVQDTTPVPVVNLPVVYGTLGAAVACAALFLVLL